MLPLNKNVNVSCFFLPEETFVFERKGKKPKLDQVQIADIHTHILPGVDDGAKDLSEACVLVRMAWENGTRAMVLTPHYRGGFKRNSPAYLQEAFEAFSETVHETYPEMMLCLGQEVHYETAVPDRLAEGAILSLCDSQYVLLEFGGRATRSQVLAGISGVSRYGFTPIVAHTERYHGFLSSPSLTQEVLDMGALIQLNADSVMGRHGFRVKRFCHRLLKKQMVHFIASDAHDCAVRAPELKNCYLWVSKKYGQEYATRIFWENAQMVMKKV